MTSTATTINKSFRLRGRSFFAMVLSPQLPVGQWLRQVDEQIERTPNFFRGQPLVLDVKGLAISRPELATLVGELNERDIRILGLEGADPDLIALGLPPALSGGHEVEAPAGADKAARRPAPRQARPSMIINEPVRSGQRIINADGDITVIGSVGSGAEIIAAGSIHIYGALRGRAFAGTSGDSGARIFCNKLDAELVAIDGFYTVADEIAPDHHQRPAQIWLEGETVLIKTLY